VNSKAKLARLLALGLALVFVAFAFQLVSHTHSNGQNEATCQICQAHLGPTLLASVLLAHSPLVPTGYVKAFIPALHEKLFFCDSPSRAPPSALAHS
jgi:hypothetical protein